MADYIVYVSSYQMGDRIIRGNFPVTLLDQLACPQPVDLTELQLKRHILSEEPDVAVTKIQTYITSLSGETLTTIKSDNISNI
jgi:hypothetical protein